MSQQNEGEKAFTVGTGGATLFGLAKLSGAYAVLNGENGEPIGAFQKAGVKDDIVTVRLFHRTFKAKAGEAFAVGASLYTGAAGVVQDTDPGAGTIRFIALEAATAAGDIVEILPKGVV